MGAQLPDRSRVMHPGRHDGSLHRGLTRKAERPLPGKTAGRPRPADVRGHLERTPANRRRLPRQVRPQRDLRPFPAIRRNGTPAGEPHGHPHTGRSLLFRLQPARNSARRPTATTARSAPVRPSSTWPCSTNATTSSSTATWAGCPASSGARWSRAWTRWRRRATTCGGRGRRGRASASGARRKPCRCGRRRSDVRRRPRASRLRRRGPARAPRAAPARPGAGPPRSASRSAARRRRSPRGR